MMNDRELFRLNILKAKRDGQSSLMGGVSVDGILAQELNATGIDVRHGVNFICRPPAVVVRYIKVVQDYLRAHEPEQYYYPVSDLHLTLVEVCHSRTPEEATQVADALRPHIDRIITNPVTPQLDSPVIVFNSAAVALSFLPTDGRLQSLRRNIHENVASVGIPVSPRYAANSAHITLMRYVKRLRSEPAEWINKLLKIPASHETPWTITTTSLTWGANWYGMRSKITEKPIRLAAAKSTASSERA